MDFLKPESENTLSQSRHSSPFGELTRIPTLKSSAKGRFRETVRSDSIKKTTNNCLIKLTQPFRVRWDVAIMMLAVYTSFWIPFSVSFMRSEYALVFVVMDSFIDAMFIIDILFNFRTSYIDIKTGDEVTEPKRICKNYVLGGFFVDLFATLPFDLIGQLLNASSSELELLALLKLIRLTRLNKIISYMRTRVDVKLAIRFAQLLLWLLLYLHCVACCWHLVISWTRNWDIPIPECTEIYSAGLLYKYSFALYYSIGLLVGIELSPRTPIEYIFCGVFLLMGAVITAVFFGEMADLVASINRPSTRSTKLMNRINTTMKNLKLPAELQDRISAFVVSTHGTVLQQLEYKKFKSDIPPSLQAEVNCILFTNVLKHTPVMCEYPEITRRLITHTDTVFFKPEQVIFKQHSASDGMFFLLVGVLSVSVEQCDGTEYQCNTLKSGDYFGEVGLLFRCPRTATVTVAEYATVAKIDAKKCHSLIYSSPEFAEELKVRAISVYNDKLLKTLDASLRRLPYVRNLSTSQFAHLLFSLRLERFPEKSVLLSEGEFASKVIILTQGSAKIYFTVKGRKTHALISKFLLEYSILYLRTASIDSTLLNPEPFKTSYDLEICTVNDLCVISGFQAIMKVPVPVTIIADTPCQAYVLDTKTLKQIAANTDGKLKLNLSMLRNSFTEVDRTSNTTILRAPAIDFYTVCNSAYKSSVARTKLKFKHAVLKLIIKFRQRRMATIPSLASIVNRLRSMAGGHTESWQKIRDQIEAGEFPTEAIELARLEIPRENSYSIAGRMHIAGQESVYAAWHLSGDLEAFKGKYDQTEYRTNQFAVDLEMVRVMSDALIWLTR